MVSSDIFLCRHLCFHFRTVVHSDRILVDRNALPLASRHHRIPAPTCTTHLFGWLHPLLPPDSQSLLRMLTILFGVESLFCNPVVEWVGRRRGVVVQGILDPHISIAVMSLSRRQRSVWYSSCTWYCRPIRRAVKVRNSVICDSSGWSLLAFVNDIPHHSARSRACLSDELYQDRISSRASSKAVDYNATWN